MSCVVLVLFLESVNCNIFQPHPVLFYILIRFEKGTDIPEPLKNEDVLNLVRKNHQSFNTLLRWLREMDLNDAGQKVGPFIYSFMHSTICSFNQ